MLVAAGCVAAASSLVPAVGISAADVRSAACMPVACDLAQGSLADSVTPQTIVRGTTPPRIILHTYTISITTDFTTIALGSHARIGLGALRGGDGVGVGTVRGCGARGTSKTDDSTRTTTASTKLRIKWTSRA